jgi:hypothetical protein
MGGPFQIQWDGLVLDLTVCCRSNDAVWGCHGANAVHFSILQEYLAARIGVGVGTLYQLSNNYHVYEDILKKVWPLDIANTWYEGGGASTPIVTDAENFDTDLKNFLHEDWSILKYHNDFFYSVAWPLRKAYAFWRDGKRAQARDLVHKMQPSDWQAAAADWFHRRINKHLGS